MLEDAKDSIWLARDTYCRQVIPSLQLVLYPNYSSELDRHEYYVLKSKLDLLYEEVSQIKARTSIGTQISLRSEIQTSSSSATTPKEDLRSLSDTESDQQYNYNVFSETALW